MKKILLYIILFLSGIDGAWALPIEKEGLENTMRFRQSFEG